MQHVNIEIKARCRNPDRIRAILQDRSARFAGADHQVDTYFRVSAGPACSAGSTSTGNWRPATDDCSQGRLKLREGNIENALIFYQRANQKGPKRSDVLMCSTTPGCGLKEVLSRALGVAVVVDKRREIYFVGNIKFHIDQVKELGSFVEIEAIGTDEDRDALLRQCKEYLERFGIAEADLVECSYSDLLLAIGN